ncbi:MAG: hypothetical protein MUF64_30675 [Polyangiaceae bacterium]|nr:hypothetical protein [Polyangiaceae bacterium]
MHENSLGLPPQAASAPAEAAAPTVEITLKNTRLDTFAMGLSLKAAP